MFAWPSRIAFRWPPPGSACSGTGHFFTRWLAQPGSGIAHRGSAWAASFLSNLLDVPAGTDCCQRRDGRYHPVPGESSGPGHTGGRHLSGRHRSAGRTNSPPRAHHASSARQSRFRIDPRHPGVRKGIGLGAPLIWSTLTGHFNAIIINWALSEAPVGTIAALGYASKAQRLVLTLPGVLATVLFPKFADLSLLSSAGRIVRALHQSGADGTFFRHADRLRSRRPS